MKFKTLTIFFILLYFPLVFTTYGQKTGSSFVKPKRIIIASDDNYPPYIFRDEKGNLRGILIDMWELWQKKTGTNVEWKATFWNEAIEIMKSGNADILETVFYTEERDQWLSFSKPYAKIPAPVYVHRTLKGIAEPPLLKGFTVGAKKGDASIEMLNRLGVKDIIIFPNYESIIKNAANGNLKIFTIDEPPALYYIYKYNLEKEFRQIGPIYTGAFHRAVLKGNEDLLAFVENGFELISESEKEKVIDKWTGKPLLTPMYSKYIIGTSIIILLAISLLIIFNHLLRKQIRIKTIELKKALDNLKQAEARWKFALEGTEQGVWDWNLETNKVNYSTKWKRMLGYEEDEISDSFGEWESRVHPDDLQNAWKDIRRHLNGETEIYGNEHRLRCKGGNYIWILDRGKVIEFKNNGEPLRMIGTHTDITYRKLNEQKLLKQEAIYRFLFEHNPAPMLIYERVTFNILAVNEAFCMEFDFSTDEVLKMKLTDLCIEEEKRILVDRASRLNGYAFTGEWHHLNKKGKIITVLSHSHDIEFEGKNARVLALTDITYLKTIEKELIEAKNKAEESDRFKTSFLANMSHEIRTPMNAILGFMELLKNPELLQAEKENYIQIIEESGKRLLTTINDIIEISKIETGLVEVERKPENLNKIIQLNIDLFKPLIDAKGLELKLNLNVDKELDNAMTDRFKFESIITNLLSNAVKFTRVGFIEVGYYRSKNSLILYVKDTGKGIPPEKLETIFEPFYQAEMNFSREHEGSGLGLTISKAYAEMLDGTIRVESELNKGSIFWFSMPLVLSQTENVTIEKKEEKIYSNHLIKPGKIIIADDHKASRLLLETILKPLGLQCINAPDGKKVLEILETEPDISLILIDIKMPIMDGYETVKKIREINKNIPIIAQTAYAFPSDRDKAIHSGCNDYISKPVIRDELIRLIYKYLSVKRI